MLENKLNCKDGKVLEFHNVEVYTKGDLKGYIQGMIEYKDRDYEFLYRIGDNENGNNFTLVGIDYGYKIEPKLTELDTNYIERYLYKNYVDGRIEEFKKDYNFKFM